MNFFKLSAVILSITFCSQGIASVCANYKRTTHCAPTQQKLQNTKINGVQVFNPRAVDPALHGTSHFNHNTGRPVNQSLVNNYTYNGTPVYGSRPINIGPVRKSPAAVAPQTNGCPAGKRNISKTPSRPICA